MNWILICDLTTNSVWWPTSLPCIPFVYICILIIRYVEILYRDSQDSFTIWKDFLNLWGNYAILSMSETEENSCWDSLTCFNTFVYKDSLLGFSFGRSWMILETFKNMVLNFRCCWNNKIFFSFRYTSTFRDNRFFLVIIHYIHN